MHEDNTTMTASKLVRLGPSVLFKEVNEATGGITPPI